jgi:pseudouridine 5'-phosphatase
MDGLLINTEDIYTICHNILLARYSAGPMAWSIKSQLQGRPAHEAIDLLLTWANLKGVVSSEEYTRQLHILQEQEFRKAKALPGVEKLLSDLSKAKSGETGKKIHVALATSSHKHHFEIKTGHLEDLFGVFVEERRILGDDARIAKGRGKPCPDIYLLALKTINDSLEEGEAQIKLEECLVFEDGIPGVVAGRRAGMRVVWVPHPGLAVEYQGREAEVLAGLGEGSVSGESGAIGDGYGEQLVSLVDFPYAKYGIITGK